VEFRKDINGLRALAVLVVLLFHFGIPGAAGGFIGVDVFFVISGFLMTGIILRRLDTGRFSLADFYLARARRILPALVLLCCVLLAVGWFALLPQDYERLDKHVLGSLGFVSNIVYWKESGYFEVASHDKWLLHTWSLSVEWQFYLVYPVLILLLRRLLPARHLVLCLAVLAIMSLAVSIYASARWPTTAFFLLPTRMWEMLAGGLVCLWAFQPTPRTGRAMEYAGLGLILLSVWLLDAQSVWPGWLAIIPVAGTMLVIGSGQHHSVITGNALAQWMGRASYSIYLWHWPVAVGLYYLGLEQAPLWIIGGIALSLLLGWLSFVLVEGFTWNRGRSVSPGLSLFRANAVMLGAGLFAVAGGVAHGFPDRLSEAHQHATRDLVMPWKQNGWCFYSVETFDELPTGEPALECPLGDDGGEVKALLFGDSFAGHYGPFWDLIGREAGWNLNSIATDWCFPSMDDEYTGHKTGRGYEQCLFNRDHFRDAVEQYDVVILAGQWGAVAANGQMPGVFQSIDFAADRAPLVIIMAAPTHFDVNVRNMYERSLLFGKDFDISRFSKENDLSAREANAALEAFAADRDNVRVIEREAMFHLAGEPSDVTKENIPYSLDEFGHISLYGSQQAAANYLRSPDFANLQRTARDLLDALNAEQYVDTTP
jgi:peptidoglycan/LPS O-acetylase OafA/YrhL